MARIGKIARLPEPIRDELCRRLQAGQLGPEILPWLNSLPEAQSLTEFFDRPAVNAQNLSDWRSGGFQDWQQKQDKTHRIKELAAFAVKLAEANGGRIAEGASAIASGKILELLESVDGAMDLDQLGGLVASLANLRGGEIAQQRADTDREKLRQKDAALALARDKFQRETLTLFIKWAQNKAALDLATGDGDNASKIQRLGQLIWGDDWKPAPGS